MSDSIRKLTAAMTGLVLAAIVGAEVAPTVAHAGETAADFGSNLGVGDVTGVARDLIARTHTSDSSPTRTSSSFKVSGMLVDDAGNSLKNAEVQVHLHPGPMLLQASPAEAPAGAMSLPLGRVLTGAGGHFVVEIPALSNISDYLDNRGVAELMFSSIGDDHVAMYNVQVNLPKWPGGDAIAPRADSWVIGAAKADSTRRLLEGADPGQKTAAEENATVGMAPVKDVLLTASRSADSKNGEGAHAPADDWNGEAWCLESKGTHVFRWQWTEVGKASVMTPIAGLITENRTSVKYEWTNTEVTEVTVGYDIQFKGASQKGGFVKSVETGNGGTAVQTAQAWAGWVRTSVEYRWQELWCYAPNGSYGGVRQWRPYRILGGAQNYLSSASYFACDPDVAKVPLSPGNSVWVSRSSTVKISGGLSVGTSAGSLGLDVSHQNTSTNKLTYTGTGNRDARLCGRNGTIFEADRVREIFTE